ncbi:TPA: hypothetical protein G8V49_004436 [Salmonella enterica]|uniref:Uncharacterized protein n=1 Tax=Salmonella enterica TaxID=28901 RepID=A0A759WIT3_SALER|nr:hypothetical protein [Salmonella enterica subsp. enterica]ELQ0399077.1 hypothetical protein [Salmonella enterica]HAG2212111.1 hypothetical protein [Salmonella enterica]
MIPFPAARCLFVASGNGSTPTVEYRSRCLFNGENMPRKRLEGLLPAKRRAEHRMEKRPSRDKPDAAHWQRVAHAARLARRKAERERRQPL